MSKSLLEELLIQAGTLNEETEKRVNTNQKTIIESTMANAVKNFIQEAVEDETNVAPDGGGVMEMGDIYEEEDVDIETGETLEDEDEEIEIEGDEEDGEDEEIEIEDDEDDEEDEEIEIEDDEDYEEDEEDEEIEIEDDDYGMDDEESFEDDEYMDDTTDFEDDEEVTDMTNASLEEVMDFIENSEDEVVVKIVKKPTYSVSVEHMDDDTEVEVSEDMLAEVISQELEEVEKMNEMNLSPVGPTKMKDESGKEYEVKAMSENRKLKKQLAQLKAENRKLKLNETKSVAALKSMMEQSKKLALVNSNLAYVSRLFTEHVTTKQEKVEILKAFDSAKTITESQKRFKILNESLSTRTQKKKLNVNIKESVNLNQQKVIKEEKAFVEDPTQANILRLMNYKSQL